MKDGHTLPGNGAIPIPLRYLLAFDASLTSAVLDIFVQSTFRWLRRKAKSELGLDSVRHAHPAAVTMVHRASSNLALNPHFHSVATDGVWVQRHADEVPVFRALPAPTRGEVTAVAWDTCKRSLALLRKVGLWLDIDPSDDRYAQEQPGLADVYSASIAGVLTVGRRAGERVLRLRGEAGGEDSFEPQGQTPGFGFSVHAKRRVSAGDRKGLERLLRYVTRPAIAQKRLELLPNGDVLWELKQQWLSTTRDRGFADRHGAL
jgi:hypothetical protein